MQQAKVLQQCLRRETRPIDHPACADSARAVVEDPAYAWKGHDGMCPYGVTSANAMAGQADALQVRALGRQLGGCATVADR